MNLRQLFDLSLVNRRAETALEWRGTEYTFGEIDARSNRVANAFRASGLVQGDRVCVYLANCIELIDIYLACVKLGLIFVPINILYRERELSHILHDAEPKRYITEAELPALVADAARQSERLEAVPLEGDAPAALVYTSGTTGASKGATITHNNFASNGVTLTGCWQITDRDRFLLALPLFHVHALGNGLHCWLVSGCRMRLLERFDHRTAADIFLDFRPTLFFGVPTMYVRLLDFRPDTAREIGQRMRLFVSGSAPLPAQVLEEFREKFGRTILERYGMTETMMNISNPYAGERRPGSVGFPLPGISVRIDPETSELHLKGPNVFAGYWRREDATRDAFVNGQVGGWFKTGDIATRSEDGYYTLSGRRSDLIISAGFNIYPREIEEFLAGQPEIAEAAVVGETDRLRGEIPVAYIVLSDELLSEGSCDLSEIEARCREKFASFKIPRRFEIIDKLPRNALGKVQKHLLCTAS